MLQAMNDVNVSSIEGIFVNGTIKSLKDMLIEQCDDKDLLEVLCMLNDHSLFVLNSKNKIFSMFENVINKVELVDSEDYVSIEDIVIKSYYDTEKQMLCRKSAFKIQKYINYRGFKKIKEYIVSNCNHPLGKMNYSDGRKYDNVLTCACNMPCIEDLYLAKEKNYNDLVSMINIKLDCHKKAIRKIYDKVAKEIDSFVCESECDCNHDCGFIVIRNTLKHSPKFIYSESIKEKLAELLLSEEIQRNHMIMCYNQETPETDADVIIIMSAHDDDGVITEALQKYQ